MFHRARHTHTRDTHGAITNSFAPPHRFTLPYLTRSKRHRAPPGGGVPLSCHGGQNPSSQSLSLPLSLPPAPPTHTHHHIEPRAHSYPDRQSVRPGRFALLLYRNAACVHAHTHTHTTRLAHIPGFWHGPHEVNRRMREGERERERGREDGEMGNFEASGPVSLAPSILPPCLFFLPSPFDCGTGHTPSP